MFSRRQYRGYGIEHDYDTNTSRIIVLNKIIKRFTNVTEEEGRSEARNWVDRKIGTTLSRE